MGISNWTRSFSLYGYAHAIRSVVKLYNIGLCHLIQFFIEYLCLLFTDTHVLICKFHRIQAWRRRLANNDDKEVVLVRLVFVTVPYSELLTSIVC